MGDRLDTRLQSADGGVLPWKQPGLAAPHPLHAMMARAGSFPPALARYFVQAYSQPGDIVLDPFCGRGTAVLEAILCGRQAIGSDIAPDAVACTRAKVTSVSFDEVSDYIDTLSYRRYALSAVPADVKVFYHPRTLSRLLCVRDHLQADLESAVPARQTPAMFVMGCMLGILHGHASYSLSLSCSHVFAMAAGYVRNYAGREGLSAPLRDVRESLRTKARIMLKNGPVPRGRATVNERSAEEYSLDDGSLCNQVSLVVTSPPYLNAQTYAKDAWLRLWLLGYDYRDIRSGYLHTGSVSTYGEKMKPCLRGMLRVLKPQSHAFVVAGDVFVRRGERKVAVRTAELLAEIAEQLDPIDGHRFNVEDIIRDSIPSHRRCYSAVHKDANAHWDEEGNGTGVRVDRILHLRKVAAFPGG